MTLDKKELETKIAELKKAYYNGHPVVSDIEYDKLLQEYKERFGEEESVGAPIKVDEIKKVKHKFPAKSLDKTKDIDKFIETFNLKKDGSDEVVLMWKLDGSTVQLTYYNGKLFNAATRGDGLIGQDITHNAKFINGIPQSIKDTGFITVRGEAVMSYNSFDKLNSNLPDEEKYENPRNLANASISVKDSKDMKDRNIEFMAFELVSHPNLNKMSFNDRLTWTYNNGFGTVEFTKVLVRELEQYMKVWEDSVKDYRFPVDGLVVSLNNAPYTDTLKGTEHHPNPLHGYAFKWADEEVETIIKDIIWQPSRTGLLNPVAIFEPVRLEGTTVERASLHNLSIMRNLHIRVGDRVTVYKANKIIPQIASNLSSGNPYSVEEVNKIVGNCPECGNPATIHKSENNIETVHCDNPDCKAKILDKLTHFCSRGCMDIAGLSESTLKKFMVLGFANTFTDIYHLNRYEQDIKSLEGFGEKSYSNIWSSIQKSRETAFTPFITALGIPGIGYGQSKLLDKHFLGDIKKFLNKDNVNYDFTKINGFGKVLSENIQNWIKHNITDDECEILNLVNIMKFENQNSVSGSNGNLPFSNKTFVVTGKVIQFKNRDEIYKFIEYHGGKVSGSVTNKTSYLVNNDISSNSGKNKKAKELGITIISEAKLIDMANGQ